MIDGAFFDSFNVEWMKWGIYELINDELNAFMNIFITVDGGMNTLMVRVMNQWINVPMHKLFTEIYLLWILNDWLKNCLINEWTNQWLEYKDEWMVLWIIERMNQQMEINGYWWW